MIHGGRKGDSQKGLLVMLLDCQEGNVGGRPVNSDRPATRRLSTGSDEIALWSCATSPKPEQPTSLTVNSLTKRYSLSVDSNAKIIKGDDDEDWTGEKVENTQASKSTIISYNKAC